MTRSAVPRVAVCGISLEASTFSPALTTAAMLAPRRDRDVLDAWDFWRPGGSLADRAEWIGILQARSIAGGAIPADDYALLRAEILAGLVTAVAEAPLDGVVLDIQDPAADVPLRRRLRRGPGCSGGALPGRHVVRRQRPSAAMTSATTAALVTVLVPSS